MGDALRFAKEAYQGQVRKGGEPYIHHPVRVAGYARLYIQSDATLFIPAAYLHDVLEDCPLVTYDILKGKFGVLIADAVKDLTNLYTKKDYPNYKRRERKRMEAERLASCSNVVQQIKLCDRLDNILDKLMYTDRDWAARYVRETYELLDLIGDANRLLSNVILERINGYCQAYPVS